MRKQIVVTAILAVIVSTGILSIRFNSKVYEPQNSYERKTNWDDLMEFVGLPEYKLDTLFPK